LEFFATLLAPLAVLQWGRDQLIAEFRAGVADVARRSVASMGPRSADRGIGFQLAITPRVKVLQWGRDQLIAEFIQVTSRQTAANALQWGRDQLIAELVRAM